MSTTHAGPAVSVFIPVYNGARHLPATLDAVLAQTCADFELICIDDASTDGSAGILASYAARDPRVRVITAPHNLGTAPRALNHALDTMTGEYFVYSSQDDLFSPDWLASMLARARETGADAVIPEVLLFHEGTASKDRLLRGLAGDTDVVLDGRAACVHSLDWSIPGNALWRASLVRRLRFDEAAVNGDEYSVRRFFLACRKVAFSGGRFLYRQDNPDAVTRRFHAGTFDWPDTQLRVAELLHEHAFPAAMVRKEIQGAVSAMAALQRRRSAAQAAWSASDVARADAAVQRFEQHLALLRQSHPTRPMASHLARWKNAWSNLRSRLRPR